MDLLELRKEIDRIDDQLIPLLMARMDVSEQGQVQGGAGHSRAQ